MNEYIIAHLVEPPAAEQFVAWPLHVTILPWFTASQPPEKMINAIEYSLADMPPLQVQANQRDFLGPYRTVPVTLIDKITGLHNLHTRFLDLLNRHDWRLSAEQYVGEAFLPHVTRKGKREIKPGTVITIDQVQLIEAPMTDPRTRLKKLIGAIKLAGKGDVKETAL